MNKNYQRGTDDMDKSKSGSVAAEVKKLIASGKSDASVLAQLKGKYHNNADLVEAIFDGYKEKLSFIQKKARKFKELINDRYSRYNLTFPQMLKKAHKYQKRYDLDDDEFTLFLNGVFNDERYSGTVVNVPNTSMAKTLGYGPTLQTSDKLRVKDNEFDILQDILKINAETKPLHYSVIVQALSHEDCGPASLVGRFKRDTNNVYSYVHPIVAAMFIPKIHYLDEHMLIASLSEIVKLKHEGKAIVTKPNYELYYDLITDPNDTVCDMSSPLNDLRNRIVLQTRLWDAVLNLRQGKYYNDRLVEFLVAVENCRNNIYDVPDLTYVKDEGAILRRLLSAFSLRPTVVTTAPLYRMLSSNPHINPTATTQVTTIPMVTLRLPLKMFQDDSEISLDRALSQAHWFVENKMLVPKSQSIIHSRDLIIFYVGRRTQMVNIARLTSPYNFNALPMTVSGLEDVNNRLVEFKETMRIRDDDFNLKSVVYIDTSTVSNLLVITGCSTGIVRERSTNKYLLYNPQNSVNLNVVATADREEYRDNAPITAIDQPSFTTKGRESGTIFIYVKSNRVNNGGVVSVPVGSSGSSLA